MDPKAIYIQNKIKEAMCSYLNVLLNLQILVEAEVV